MSQNDKVLIDDARMGRPVIFDKPLKRTFTINSETEDILNALAKENRCSRSDALVMAVTEYWKVRRR